MGAPRRLTGPAERRRARHGGDRPQGAYGRKVSVGLPGGNLDIEWRAADDHILMTGLAVGLEGVFEFDGRPGNVNADTSGSMNEPRINKFWLPPQRV